MVRVFWFAFHYVPLDSYISNIHISHSDRTKIPPNQPNPLSSSSLLTLLAFSFTPSLPPMQDFNYAPVCAAAYMAMATGLRVCMKTVPGPVNLHTRPSLAAKLLMIPPDAIRSSV